MTMDNDELTELLCPLLQDLSKWKLLDSLEGIQHTELPLKVGWGCGETTVILTIKETRYYVKNRPLSAQIMSIVLPFLMRNREEEAAIKACSALREIGIKLPA